jgi:hypothetical protein
MTQPFTHSKLIDELEKSKDAPSTYFCEIVSNKINWNKFITQFRLMLTLDHAQRSKKKTIVLGLEKKGIGGIF